jgi:hypothetical protein
MLMGCSRSPFTMYFLSRSAIAYCLDIDTVSGMAQK